MTPKKKTPRAAPRARSGKHLHAGVLVRAPEVEREQWKRFARRAGVSRVDYVRVACALGSDLHKTEIWESLAILEADARKVRT